MVLLLSHARAVAGLRHVQPDPDQAVLSRGGDPGGRRCRCRRDVQVGKKDRGGGGNEWAEGGPPTA